MSLLNKKVIKSSLITLFSVSLALNSIAQETDTYLMVRNYPDMMPVTFLDETSQPSGFEKDLLDEIIKRVDVSVEVEFASGFTPAMKKVEDGKADMVMAGVAITEARKPYYDFSDPYFLSSPVTILTKDDSIASAADLIDKRVGVMSKSSHEMRIRGVKGDSADDGSVVTYDTIFLAIRALMRDQVDAVIGDDSYLFSYLERYPDMGLIVKVDDSYPKDEYAIAFKKGSTKLKHKVDSALHDAIEDGTYEQILKKWYPNLEIQLN